MTSTHVFWGYSNRRTEALALMKVQLFYVNRSVVIPAGWYLWYAKQRRYRVIKQIQIERTRNLKPILGYKRIPPLNYLDCSVYCTAVNESVISVLTGWKQGKTKKRVFRNPPPSPLPPPASLIALSVFLIRNIFLSILSWLPVSEFQSESRFYPLMIFCAFPHLSQVSCNISLFRRE